MAERTFTKRIVRILLLTVAGLLLLPVAVSAYIVLTYSDDDYRKLLTRSVEFLTGDQLSIGGRFSLVAGETLELSAGAIDYRSADGMRVAAVDALSIRLALRPLLKRRLVVHSFELGGARLDIREAGADRGESAEGHEPFPMPVVDNIRLQDVRLNYFKHNDERPVTLYLESMAIDDLRPGDPLRIAASGSVSDRHFSLTGQTGDVQSLMQGTAAFPVSLQLELDELSLHVNGNIADPAAGRGLDLNLTGEAAALEDVLRLYHIDTPRLGRLQAAARVTGELVAPTIQELSASLRRDRVSVQLSGEIADPLQTREVSLELRAAIEDPLLLAHFLPDPLPPLRQLNLTGTVSGKRDRYWIRDLDLSVRGKRALVLALGGSARLLVDASAVTDIDASLRFDAASSGALRSLVPDIPLIGPVGLEARLRGTSRRLSVTGLRAQAGRDGDARLSAEGKLAVHNLSGKATLGPTDLKLGASAPSTRDLLALAGLEAPDIGAVVAAARLNNSDGSLGLEDLAVDIDRPGAFRITAEGAYGDLQRGAGIALAVTGRASSLAAIGAPFGVVLPERGEVTLAGRINGARQRLALRGGLELARSTLDLDLRSDLSGVRPRLSGRLSIPRLHVGDLGLEPSGSATANKPDAAPRKGPGASLFSEAPIDLAALERVDLDLALRIGEVVGTRRLYDSVAADLRLDDAVLQAQPVEIGFTGGKVEAAASVDARSRPPRFSVRFLSDELGIGELLEQKDGSEAPLRGFLTSNIELRSRGASVRELAGNLEGHVELISESANISRRHLELLTKDVFGWTLSALVRRQSTVNIDCAMTQLQIDQGVVKTDALVVDWPGASVRADVTVDLGDESLAAVIYPKQKRKLLWNTAKPIRVSGPLREPEVKATSVREISESAAQITLFAPLMISADLLGGLSSMIRTPKHKRGGCAQYIESPAG